MPSAYPTGNDLKTFLTGKASPFDPTIAPYSYLDYDALAMTGRLNFEQAVGRTMLATTQTRVFNPPFNNNSRLFLGADLASLTTLTIGGVSKTRNTDFWLYPLECEVNAKPFEWIDFRDTWFKPLTPTMVRSIAITGLWGYSATIPQDAWDAMCYNAGILAIGSTLTAQSGGLKSLQIDNAVKEEYDVASLAKIVSVWRMMVDMATGNYGRNLP